jgi:tripartite ATP-independent transporter DctP family solute receptor
MPIGFSSGGTSNSELPTDASTKSGNGNAANSKVITLKYAHDDSVDSSYQAGALEFQRLVGEKTGGVVKVDVYPAAQLGTEMGVLESARMGTVDFANCGLSNASTVFPELSLFGTSYLFQDQAHLDACLADGNPLIARLKELVADKKTGVQIGGFFTIGQRSVVNNKGPIVTPNDLQGIKIRVMASPVETEVWATLGALPTSIPGTEQYSALQSGVINAAENAPVIIFTKKLYEAAPYYSLTEHQFFISPVWVSDKVQGKTGNYYQAVMDALKEASVHQRKVDVEINEKAMEDLAANGAIINDDVDKQAFADKLAPLQDKVAEQYSVQDILEMIRAENHK